MHFRQQFVKNTKIIYQQGRVEIENLLSHALPQFGWCLGVHDAAFKDTRRDFAGNIKRCAEPTGGPDAQAFLLQQQFETFKIYLDSGPEIDVEQFVADPTGIRYPGLRDVDTRYPCRQVSRRMVRPTRLPL